MDTEECDSSFGVVGLGEECPSFVDLDAGCAGEESPSFVDLGVGEESPSLVGLAAGEDGLPVPLRKISFRSRAL